MSQSDERATILVVDDLPENIDILKNILNQDYKIKAATNGQLALKIAQADPHPDMILLDIMMPDMDGYHVCSALKQDYRTSKIPVIFVTAKGEVSDESQGFDLGAVDYITKPVSPPLVRRRVKNHLQLYDQKRALEDQVAERTQELEDSRLQIIHRLGRAAEFKDNETGMHVKRMSFYSKILAKAAGFTEPDQDLVLRASPMHDIGKIGIPDSILLKPGKLDADEWDVMRQHPEIGARILGEHQSDLMSMAREIALCHHEKFDGSGYPNGLAGEAIPLAARVVTIADVFDALTTKRPYKAAWSIDDATEFLVENKGLHFDPELVPLFINCLPEVLQIKEEYAEIEEE